MKIYLKIPTISEIVFGNISKTHPEYTQELLSKVVNKPAPKKELKKPLTYHKKRRIIHGRP